MIFVSDHGDSLGDHGLFVKGVHLYDEAIRVPLLMRWPGHIPAGKRIAAPVQLQDLAATVLAAAGIEPPPAMHASANLLPLCTGQQESVHPYVTCVYRNTGINDKKAYFDPPLDSTMIRDDRYKLIFYHAVSMASVGLSIQLFDMATDPHEQHNLVDAPELAAVKARLLAELADWLRLQARQAESSGGEALPGAAWTSVIDNRFSQ